MWSQNWMDLVQSSKDFFAQTSRKPGWSDFLWPVSSQENQQSTASQVDQMISISLVKSPAIFREGSTFYGDHGCRSQTTGLPKPILCQWKALSLDNLGLSMFRDLRSHVSNCWLPWLALYPRKIRTKIPKSNPNRHTTGVNFVTILMGIQPIPWKITKQHMSMHCKGHKPSISQTIVLGDSYALNKPN